MVITQRLRRSRLRREARARGFEVAVGLPPRPEGSGLDREDATCPSCGAAGRIDLVDVSVAEANLTCRRCAATWTTARQRDRTDR